MSTAMFMFVHGCETMDSFMQLPYSILLLLEQPGNQRPMRLSVVQRISTRAPLSQSGPLRPKRGLIGSVGGS